MPSVRAEVSIRASLAQTWDFYFEPAEWPSWVDGFGSVESSDGYPDRGGTLVWRSTPAGRGTVRERVLAHEPRTAHRIAFEDPESSGEQTTRFGVAGESVDVSIELDYALAGSGPLSWATDVLFIRSQMRASLRRTLARLRLEVEELADQ